MTGSVPVTRRRPFTAAFLAALLVSAALPPAARAQDAAASGAAAAAVPTIGVRAGVHPGYTRLVFDWEQAAAYTIDREGDRVTVRFAAPGRADLRPAQRVRPSRIADLADAGSGPDGMAVSFTVPAGSVLRDFRSGMRLVVDIQDGPPGSAAAAVDRAPPAQSAPAPAAVAQGQGQAQVPARGAAPAATPETPLFMMPGRGSGAPGAQEAARSATASPARPQAEPQAVAPTPAPAPAAPAAPANQPQATPPAMTAPVPATAAAEAPAPPAQPVPVVEEAPPVRFSIDTRRPAAAVVYERAGWLYILFDREVDSLPTGAIPGLSGPVEVLAMEEGSGFRVGIPPFLVPQVGRDGSVWSFTFHRANSPAAAAMPGSMEVKSDPEFVLGARMLVVAPDAADVLSFRDPVVGDLLKLVPLPQPGELIAEPRRFREAELLPSAQGLVVRPIDDRLQVRTVREGVDITVPGGLRLSPGEDALAANPPPPPVETFALFDYERWGQVPPARFIQRRQALTDRLADTTAETRNRARLDLARFFAANGFGHEALGQLALIQQEQPDVDRRPEFLAVRGIARTLTGDSAGAIQDLAHPDVTGEADADLWRARAASQAGDHALAHRLFTARRALLDSYPEPFFTPMAMAALDSALAQGAPEAGALIADRMVRRGSHNGPHAAHVQYRRARVHRALGDTDKAEQALAALAAGNDRLNRTLATRDLIELRLETGKITPQQAAEEFEKLRFAWRGDGLELAIQRRLGELHVKAGNYAQGFDTMRRTISLFPEDPQAVEIAADLTRTFSDLFAKDGAAHLTPLEALSLYEQYRELTPPGEAGDLIIRRLAERLVEIDLLDRAAELLDRQVQFRLAGVEKARVGARLAAIRLLDNRAEEALTALDKSNVPGVPSALEAERRLLRARALSRSGRSADAVALLAADRSAPADFLRIDIAWKDKQWGAAAQALGDVIGPPPPAGQGIDTETARLVVNRAVALSLAQDDAGLAALRDRFGPAMSQTGEAQVFAVLTRPGETVGLMDLGSIQSRVAEIDMFRSFLDRYRTRQEASAAPPSGPRGN